MIVTFTIESSLSSALIPRMHPDTIGPKNVVHYKCRQKTCVCYLIEHRHRRHHLYRDPNSRPLCCDSGPVGFVMSVCFVAVQVATSET